jgi:hypothetical protein
MLVIQTPSLSQCTPVVPVPSTSPFSSFTGEKRSNVPLGQGKGMMPVKTLLDCVERAGPDIAINHTEGTQGEHKGLVLEPAPIGVWFMVGNGAAIARVGMRIQGTPARISKF